MKRRRRRPEAPGRVPGRRQPAKRRAIQVTPLETDAPVESGIRLNRFLASAGLASRRGAEELITEGRVTVNGEPVLELGTRVDPDRDDVRCDGARVRAERKTYLLFNKPKGVVCTNAPNEQRKRVIDCLPDVRGRLFTIGRLDADSEGLILLTNDGDFAQLIAHPRHGVAKTYAVLVRGRVDRDSVEKARGGVWLSEGRTAGARIRVQRLGRDRSFLRVILREGRNREIRRVFAKLGHPVLSLKRVQIGPLNLHGLGSGKFRFLRGQEIAELRRLAEGGE